MIKAVIFDFHDTVIENGYYSVFTKNDVLKSETWQPFWKGEITEKEFWQRAAVDVNKDNVWIRKSPGHYYSNSFPIEGMLLLVERLGRQYKLALLANAPKPWFDDAVARFDLEKAFDVLVSSGDTGFLKPDKEIYLLTCQKLKVSPSNCFYIDDDQVKLRAAQDLGMLGILFKSKNQLTRDLKKMGF